MMAAAPEPGSSAGCSPLVSRPSDELAHGGGRGFRTAAGFVLPVGRGEGWHGWTVGTRAGKVTRQVRRV
jgi:hypothetical protein